MNPMTNVKNIKKLNEQELRRNLKTSWHDQYKDSAWIFVGGLPYDLTEGDIICVFSQYGEVVNINLVRDKDTGKQKGFCFLCYEDQRSTVLAVDNFNGIKLLGRTLRVDHVSDYKAPKDSAKKDAETRRLQEEGCASSAFQPTNNPATTTPNMIPNVKKEKEDDKSDCMIIEKKTPVMDLPKGEKSEVKSKKKRKDKVDPKVRVKKEKDSDKKKKRNKRRSSSSSSSDESSSSGSSTSESSSTSSSEDSDSDKKRAHLKKHKHKLEKKKKLKNDESGQHETQSSASSKRRKLEEKIKALEKALNSVRSGKSKQK